MISLIGTYNLHMFYPKRFLLGLGSLDELCNSARIQDLAKENIQVLFNSQFSTTDHYRIATQLPHALVYEWEPCLLQGKYFNIGYDSKVLLQDLTTNELLILRRLYLRHIQSRKNQHTFELISLLMLRWIIAILTRHDIDTVVCSQIPHQYADYLLIPACRLLNIKILIVKSIQVFHSDAYRVWDPLANVYMDVSGSSIYDHEKVLRFSEKIHSKLIENNVPYTQQRFSRESELRRKVSKEMLHNITCIDETISERMITYLIDKKSMCKNLYDSSIKLDSLASGRGHLVVFLHFEPECNVCPLGDINYDQLTFIDKLNILCKTLGLKLLVREHPVQIRLPMAGVNVNSHFLMSNTRRPRDLYYYSLVERFSEFSGYCQLDSINDILSSASVLLTASVAGTVSLQSAIRGLNTVVGTSQWFDTIPGVYNIDNLIKSLADFQSTDHPVLNKRSPLNHSNFHEYIKNYIIVK